MLHNKTGVIIALLHSWECNNVSLDLGLVILTLNCETKTSKCFKCECQTLRPPDFFYNLNKQIRTSRLS